jgi:DNA repair protein RadD
MAELRPYQEDALKAIRETVGQGVQRLVCQAPTGSGKTLLAAAIVEGARRKANRICFVVPAISLIDQTVEMFWKQGIREIGVIQANHQLTDWSRPVQVASIQTVRSRGMYPEAAVVVFDECHQLHREHVKWLTHPDWQKTPIIGLSATPWTRGLGRYFQSLLVMSTTKELIDQGYLSKFRVYAADHPDLSGVKTVAGDYHEGQLSTVMQGEGLVANIVETWRTHWNKDKTFLFAVDCAHAQMLQERFRSCGINCAYQDAKTTTAERAAIKRGFHSGEIKIIANVGTLTTGVDYDVRCLILARPTKSEMLYVQIVGRALRTAEGKERALILDHTDTTARLGMVTDIHHEHLDDGRSRTKKATTRRRIPLPKPCPKCAYIIPVNAKTCPECGFERKVVSKVFEREGELVELDGRPKKKTDPRLFPYTQDEKRAFFAQLRTHGMRKGYKRGWAAVQYREKFKDWPARSWEYDQLLPVGAEVANFIRSRIIKWAMQVNDRSKKAGAAAPGAAGVASGSVRTGSGNA